MEKKLQVYISSTFADLVEERYAAVEAVRRAGHIPAGIELFFKENQPAILKRWIDESDVYILILGGFYGLLLRDESKSYTHWEYDYAGEAGKPRIAFVVTDDALRQKPYDFSEIEHFQKFQAFKQSVMEEVPTYYVEDIRHINMVLRELLPEFKGREDLHGWFSGRELPDVQKVMEENERLLRENARLQDEIARIKKDKVFMPKSVLDFGCANRFT